MQFIKQIILFVAIFIGISVNAQTNLDKQVALKKIALEKYARLLTSELTASYQLTPQQASKVYHLMYRKGEKLQIIEQLRQKDNDYYEKKRQSAIIHARTGLKTIMNREQYYAYSRAQRLAQRR